MPGSLVPPESPPVALQPYDPGLPPAFTGEPSPRDPVQVLTRSVAALLRYKWLIVAMALLGTTVGVAASRLVSTYEAQGTIWISQETPERNAAGPIRAAGLLPSTSWPDLLRSYAVLDRVTRELRLFVRPDDPRLVGLFDRMEVGDRVSPGHYVLRVDSAGGRYTLSGNGERHARVVEEGTIGDSVGRTIGVRWAPPAEALRLTRTIAFSLATPRAASIQLRDQLRTELPRDGNLLRAFLTGTNSAQTARTLNEVMTTFVATATELKRRNLTEVMRTLEQQLTYAGGELREAEIALENFRVQTITLPSEGTVVSGGIEATRDPVLTTFFNQKIEYEGLAHDRAALERTLAEVRAGRLGVDALWPVLPTDDGAQDLRLALTEYTNKEAALRTARQVYTDEHRTVRELLSALVHLREETIPALAQTVITQLRQRELDLGDRIASASRNLQEIPVRTIEEGRLRRNVEVRAALYTMLRNRYEEARLAETSSIPDVAVLDPAVMPEAPVANRARLVIALALAGSLGLGVMLALLLDRTDRKIHYLDQVTRDLGMRLLCAVPPIRNRLDREDLLQAAELVEAFRILRINVAYSAARERPLALTITSVGKAEGKSLVSANLALAFAEGGYRTLLVDADTRRGALHSTFGVERRPGLTDVLRDSAEIGQAFRPTSHTQLTLLPMGSRTRLAPELLASSRFGELLNELGTRFDVIIVDSPPLTSGMDPYALGAATGNLVLVVRMGATDRNIARIKLELLSRFPISVLGAVVNDLPTRGSMAREYGYTYPSDHYQPLDELSEVNELQPVS